MSIDDVLTFWFSSSDIGRWFRRDDTFDAEIRERFGALHEEAAAGGLNTWRGTARGELALILVLDQFSRNLHRDDPRAFAQDERALGLARDLLASGRIAELDVTQRMFALMPFQHSEDRATQRESVPLFEQHVPIPNAVDFAKQHAAIIERFGRFPHRNKVLRRNSTPEEEAFLKQPGSSF